MVCFIHFVQHILMHFSCDSCWSWEEEEWYLTDYSSTMTLLRNNSPEMTHFRNNSPAMTHFRNSSPGMTFFRNNSSATTLSGTTVQQPQLSNHCWGMQCPSHCCSWKMLFMKTVVPEKCHCWTIFPKKCCCLIVVPKKCYCWTIVLGKCHC